VPIPPFDATGRLPFGRHITDVLEVERRLVAPFALSITRRGIYRGWRSRRQAIAALVPRINQEWVSGSFASSKRDPGDVDVVIFLEVADIDTLEIVEKQELTALVVGNAPRLRFGTHSFICPVSAPSHPEHAKHLHLRGYWDDWWSHDKNGNECGYLDVRGDP